MADTSRPQFTITLGHSGQVVKRAGDAVDSGSLGSVSAAGIKRSVRDRLGSNVDAVHLDNKRWRGAGGGLSSKASNGVDDTHLSKHDLRFKIMKKSERNGKLKNLDLRDTLSRKTRPSSTNLKVHQSLPEPVNSRQRAQQLTPGQKDVRRCMPEPKDGHWDPVEVGQNDRWLIRDPLEVGQGGDRRLRMGQVEVGSRDDKLLIRDPVEVGPRDDRRAIRAPIEVGPHMHKPYDDRQPNLDPTDGGMPSGLMSTRTTRSLSQMDLSKTSFSLGTLDRLSRPPSHKVLDSSASISSPPPLPPLMEEPLRRPLMRPFNDPRPVPYTSQDIHEIPRPMATSFRLKPSLSDGPITPVGPLVAPHLPTGGMAQQNQYPVEYHTVEGFLHSLGLDKYMILFKVEEVDIATLRQMGDHDLKEMGIPMGPRKKILLALHARNRRLSTMRAT